MPNMKLTLDIQRRLARGQMTLREAFEEQAVRDAAQKAGIVIERGYGPTTNVAEAWKAQHDDMVAKGPQWIADLVAAHDRCVEARTDFSECQKNARRSMILDLWHSSEVKA